MQNPNFKTIKKLIFSFLTKKIKKTKCTKHFKKLFLFFLFPIEKINLILQHKK